MDRSSDDKSSTMSSLTGSEKPVMNEKAPNMTDTQQRSWTSTFTNLLPLWLRSNTTAVTTPTTPEPISSQRKQYISTTSSSLTGTYSLFDLLRINSQSGRINITIEPQPSDPETPAPAELKISSLSGSIAVNMPFSNAPNREYITAINSMSGSIDARMIHGVRTRVEAMSGSISLRLVMEGRGYSTLSTICKSGRTNVSLDAGTSGEVIGDMRSSHSTMSGSMTLRYPREWSGTIKGRSQSGSINLRGPGLEIVRRSPQEVVARKGDGGSRMELKTMSGNVNVYFE